MPLLSRAPKDAAGAPINPEAIYSPIDGYATEESAYRTTSRLRGSHAAVVAHPELWLPELTPDDERQRIVQRRWDRIVNKEA